MATSTSRSASSRPSIRSRRRQPARPVSQLARDARSGHGASHAPASTAQPSTRRSLHLHHPPVVQRHAAVHARGELHVVGGDHGGEARGAHELRQRLEHVLGGARIEIAGRLVGQQDARRIGDRARDRDALLLAAGQLAPAGASSRSLEAEIAQQLVGALARFACATGRGSSAAASRSRPRRTPAADGGTDRRSRSRCGGCACARHPTSVEVAVPSR